MISKINKESQQNLIPSIRAAQLSGYSQDYVGQLCRAGSIDCIRVMGEWRVDLQSLLAYKKRFNPDFNLQSSDSVIVSDSYSNTVIPTPVGHKDVFTKDGVEYISSAEASDITGYSQDYIGQLARSASIPAEKVGRKWFVAKKDLLNHKEHNDSLLLALQQKSAGIKKTDAHYNNIAIKKLPTVTYKHDDGTLINQISKEDKLNRMEPDNSAGVSNTPAITKIMDLRNTRYSNKNKHISDKVIINNNPITENDNVTQPKNIVKSLSKYIVFLILLIEVIIIALLFVLPEVIVNYIQIFRGSYELFSKLFEFLYSLDLVHIILNTLTTVVNYKP